jgi:hypothetical protein
MGRLVAALIVVASLSLVSPSAAVASSDTMGQHQAGTYYMHTVCPANHAIDRFSRQIWRGRKTITFAEVARRLPEIRKASRRLSAADFKATKRLYHPPADWPSYVARPIAKMINGFEGETRWSNEMGGASTSHAWGRYWRRYLHVKFGTAPTTIRARLNLPAPGKGC